MPANLSIAAHSPFVCGTRGTRTHADLTYYTDASGAGVINFSSMGFVMAMDQLNRSGRFFPAQTQHFARQVFRNALFQASRGRLGNLHRPSGNAKAVIDGYWKSPIVAAAGGAQADVIAVNGDTGDLWRYRTSLGPTLSGSKVGQNWGEMTWMSKVSDLNHDGKDELVARRADGTLWLFPGRSTGYGAAAQVGRNWQSMDTLTVTPDVTGDLKPDLFARHADGRLIRYSFTGLNQGLSGATVVGKNWQAMTALVAVNDITGDQRPDLLGVNRQGQLFVYTTRNNVLTSLRQVGNGWTGFRLMTVPGDLDGDGRDDLLGVRADGNLYYYRNRGTSWGSAQLIGRRWTGISLLA